MVLFWILFGKTAYRLLASLDANDDVSIKFNGKCKVSETRDSTHFSFQESRIAYLDYLPCNVDVEEVGEAEDDANV